MKKSQLKNVIRKILKEQGPDGGTPLHPKTIDGLTTACADWNGGEPCLKID